MFCHVDNNQKSAFYLSINEVIEAIVMRVKRKKWVVIAVASLAFVMIYFNNKKNPGRLIQSMCPVLKNYDEEKDPRLQATCASLIAGEKLKETTKFAWSTVPDGRYVELTRDCRCFRSEMGYLTTDDLSEEEKEFPLAFSLLMYENLEQVERLLRLIYRPHNVYCLHVDSKATVEVQQGVKAISNCFDNVFIAAPAVNISWGEISIVDAELLCMKKLLEFKSWKYFINLVGRDFPLRTNLELVQLLKAYKGANDIDGSTTKRFKYWNRFVWKDLKKTNVEKSPPPHNFSIAKGSTHIAAVRGFVEFTVNDRRASDLKDWFNDTYIPDEHYFNTLHLNPQFGIPGAFKGDPDAKSFHTRHKLIGYGSNNTCHGKWIREFCAFGIGDLPTVVTAQKMFANKFFLNEDPLAFRCMELWYKQRVRHPAKDFDVSFYANQPFALNHV